MASRACLAAAVAAGSRGVSAFGSRNGAAGVRSLSTMGGRSAFVTSSSYTAQQRSVASPSASLSQLAGIPHATTIRSRLFSTTEGTDPDEIASVEAQIATKGDEIRTLKENGIEKPELAPHIEELLALKAKLAGLLEPAAAAPPKKEKKQTSVSNASKMLSSKPMSSTEAAAPRVKTVNAEVSEGQVSIKGWVRTVRKQKTLAFVEVNDGSSMSGIQCVLPFDKIDEDTLKGEFRLFLWLMSFMVVYIL